MFRLAILVAALTPLWGQGHHYVNAMSQSLGPSGGTTSPGLVMTGANIEFVCLSYQGTISSLTDSGSNTWTLVATETTAGSNKASLYYSYAPSGLTSQTWTATGTSVYVTISVLGFSGAQSSPLDQHTVGAVDGGALTTSLVPTASNALTVSCNSGEWSFAYTKGANTIAAQTAYTGGTNYAGAISFHVMPSVSTESVEWHWKDIETDAIVTADFLPAVGTTYNVITGYGAVGNGTTNDTTAIQNAINACSNGTVLFPGGHTYLVNNTLTLVGNCSYTQTGTGAAEIKNVLSGTCGNPDSNSGHAFLINSNVNEITISNLTLTNLGIIISGNHGNAYTITGVTVQDKLCTSGNQFFDFGVVLSGISSSGSSNVIFTGNTITNVLWASSLNLYAVEGGTFVNGNTIGPSGGSGAGYDGADGISDTEGCYVSGTGYQNNNNVGTQIYFSSLVESQCQFHTYQFIGNVYTNPTNPVVYFAYSLADSSAINGRVEDNTAIDPNIGFEWAAGTTSVTGVLAQNNYIAQDSNCTPYAGSGPPTGQTGCGGGGMVFGQVYNSTITNNVICGPTFASNGVYTWTESGYPGAGFGNTLTPQYTSSSCTVSVTGITSNSGPAGGGNAVTITGTLFGPGSTVTFGPNAATNVVFVSATTIIATVPAGSGTVSVTVTPPLGSSFAGTLANGYSYSGGVGPVITTTSLPGGTTGVAYSQTLMATGGTPPYSNWTVTVGSLPPGLALASSTGIISGTPTTTGTYNFSVTVQDSVPVTSSAQALSIMISAPLGPSSFTGGKISFAGGAGKFN